ncbi:MliC family protein [Pseudovibrio exalbescens]|uniref:Membrane-bound lysozyme-inhibitor of c-type lysozyme n=1 Tax=Pseudovibrio exalbescens TaxID=197461 RepID=A0A1U7JM71_9HYPH|nr:MliC family protein [Pseudovibrio exalbescens]OKL45792.1 hypothetical protein A3843_01315 [Pseudovibrio exalbescens]
MNAPHTFLAAIPFCVLAVTGTSAATTPTFDCAKASGSVEEMICADENLAGLDRKLDEVWQQVSKKEEARAENGDTPRVEQWKAVQRGWIKGRNECWKAPDVNACVTEAYEKRISELEVLYDIAPLVNAVVYACDGEAPRRISASFYNALKPGVLLERGDETLVGLQAISASGARYVANFGVEFWTKGDTAFVTWPQGTEFSCHVTDE